MKFYTNALIVKDEVLLRGYEDGRRVQHRIPCKPYLFLRSKNSTAETTLYCNLHGQPVDRIDFESPAEARDFVTRYKDVGGMEIYGMTNYVYPMLNDHYPGQIDYDATIIKRANLDIEVESDKGFPNIDQAEQAVTAITVKQDDVYYVFGCGQFKTTDNNVKYYKCSDEKELLLKFLDLWSANWFSPDVVTGWNIEFFDIPYLYNRIVRVLGVNLAKKLSPWFIVRPREVIIAGRTSNIYEIAGIAILDYLQLYKKFTFSMQESYRLDHIAFVELGERKLDYSEYDSLFDLYKRNYQLFIEYNIRDVDLVDRLDDKLKFIEQVYAIAYDGKVNFADAFTSVRMWDVIIHNYLADQRIVVPQPKFVAKDRQITGAYVKDPKVGMYKWVVSFDLNSLYPHLIMQYNISPETYVDRIEHIDGEAGVLTILNGLLDQPKYRDGLIDNNLSCAGSGCLFDNDRQGFLPKLMEKMYNDRVLYKNKMLDAKKALEQVEKEMSRRGLKL